MVNSHVYRAVVSRLFISEYGLQQSQLDGSGLSQPLPRLPAQYARLKTQRIHPPRSMIGRMNRRCLLGRTATVLAGSVPFAGCSRIPGSEVDLVVQNSDETNHEFAIRATGDFEERTTSGALSSEESTTVFNFIPTLDYAHVTKLDVTIDGSPVREEDVVIDSQRDVTIEVSSAQEVEIRPSEIISPSGEANIRTN